MVVSPALTGTAASWLKPSLTAAGYEATMRARPRATIRRRPAPRWRDVWSAGQGVHAMTAIEPVAEIVDELERGWNDGRARLLNTGTPA